MTPALTQSRALGLSMSPRLLYRIAAVLFILFALGHTIGFLTLKPPTTEALAVRDAMSKVQFQISGATLSYGGFYRAFGLNISAYLFFSSFLAWHLASLAVRQPGAIGMLGWAFFALQLAGLALSWIYLAGGPVIFSGVMALCLGLAAFTARSTPA
jgi:hypothetical protein